MSEVVPAAEESEEEDAPARRSIGSDETQPGTVLKLGEPAVVAMEVGGQRGLFEVAVVKIAPGDASDLHAFGAGDGAGGQPYYVTVSVKNVGDTAPAFASLAHDFHGALDGGSRAPEVGTDSDFRWCPTTPTPSNFRKGRSFETCRVFVAPAGATLDAVVYEGYGSPYTDDPIVWRP